MRWQGGRRGWLIGLLCALILLATGPIALAQSGGPTARMTATAPSAGALIRDYEEVAPTFARPAEPSDWQMALGVIGSLALVVVILYATLWGVKAFVVRKGGIAGRTSLIRVWETVHLSPQRALHVVEVGGQLLLVGATDSQVSLVAELDREALAEHDPFGARLAQAMAQPASASLTHVDAATALAGLRDAIGQLRNVRAGGQR